MQYDVFISYTRDDDAWAARLGTNLGHRGFAVFLDKRRLAGGDEWEPALRDAIIDSRTLLVLWSEKAAASKWVFKEQEAFRQMMHVNARDGKPSVRRLLQVCLQGVNPDYPAFQTISDLLQQQAYAGGADAVNVDLWNGVLEKAERAIRLQMNLPVVHQLILASTRERMQDLADDSRASMDATPCAELIEHLRFHSRDELLARYGETRSEWRPFGGEKSVLTIMSELREKLLGRGAPPFLWQPVAEEMWTGIDNKRALGELLRSQPCAIVLDVMSLYDAVVDDRGAPGHSFVLAGQRAFGQPGRGADARSSSRAPANGPHNLVRRSARNMRPVGFHAVAPCTGTPSRVQTRGGAHHQRRLCAFHPRRRLHKRCPLVVSAARSASAFSFAGRPDVRTEYVDIGPTASRPRHPPGRGRLLLRSRGVHQLAERITARRSVAVGPSERRHVGVRGERP